MDATKKPRGLGVRLALTVVPVVALLFASTKLLVPGVDEGLVHRVNESTPFAVAANVSIFAIGVMPFVYSYFLVELVALSSKKLRKLRHGSPEGRATLDRWARGLALLFAVFQAYGVAQALAALSSSDFLATTMPSISVPVATASLVGGSCVAMLIADLVTRQGIVNGLLFLPVVDLVVRSASELRTAHAKAMIAGTWEARHVVVVIGTIALVLFAGWASTRGANDLHTVDGASSGGERSAYRDARALVVEPWVPVPSSSIAPYSLAASILMLPATLTAFKLPFDGVQRLLERGDATFYVAFVALIVFLTFVLTRMLHRPGDAEDLARRLGTSIDPSKVLAAQNRALGPTLLFFAAIIVAGAALGLVPFQHVSIAYLPVVAALVIDAWHAIRLTTGFTGVWQERRAAAVPVLRAALESRGIETRVTGAATHALLQAWAPYAPVTIHVPIAEAERATKVLRHLLLGEDAPEAEPDEPKKKKDESPTWTMRTRVVALGAALLAACGLLGIARVKSTPPSARAPAKLELLAVADDSDLFAELPDSSLPEGIEIRVEQVPVGQDAYGRRKTERGHFASVSLRPGETVDRAIARGEAWAKTLPLPERIRVAWEKTEDFDPDTGTTTPSGARSFLLEGDSVLSNADIMEAMAMMDSRSGVPESYVAITLAPEAAERFRALTAAKINQRIAIVLDGRVNSAPVVRSEIGGGRISITMGAGDPDKRVKEAQALARALSQR